MTYSSVAPTEFFWIFDRFSFGSFAPPQSYRRDAPRLPPPPAKLWFPRALCARPPAEPEIAFGRAGCAAGMLLVGARYPRDSFVLGRVLGVVPGRCDGLTPAPFPGLPGRVTGSVDGFPEPGRVPGGFVPGRFGL